METFYKIVAGLLIIFSLVLFLTLFLAISSDNKNDWISPETMAQEWEQYQSVKNACLEQDYPEDFCTYYVALSAYNR